MKRKFRQRYGIDPQIVSSPGYVHLLGEHSGFEQGLTLSIAIDSYVYLAISKRADWILDAMNEEEPFSTALFELGTAASPWQYCLEGVIGLLLRKGHELTGMNLMIWADDSSKDSPCFETSLCCGLALALNNLYSLGYNRAELSLISREARATFAADECSLMDYYACFFAKKGHALKMDLLTSEFSYLPLQLADMDLILLEPALGKSKTESERSHSAAECNEALRLLRIANTSIKSIRYANLQTLYRDVLAASPLAFKRAKYILLENERVEQVGGYLKNNEFNAFGALLISSHTGNNEQGPPPAKELEQLILLIRNMPKVLGYRLTQNNQIIVLVRKDYREWLKWISTQYFEQPGKVLQAHRLSIVGRAAVLDELK